MAENKEKFDEEENELEEKDDEELEDDSGASDLKEGGIFDEDLNLADEDISDFSIGDIILSSAPSVHGRQAHNLEELAGRRKAEDSKWDDSSEFDDDKDTKQDFYSSSGGDFYGENKNGDNSYLSGNNNNLYNNKKDDLYTGESSSGKKVYDARESDVKSYGQFTNNRRSGRSMLEIAGFEDKEKQKSRDIRGFVKYEGKA